MTSKDFDLVLGMMGRNDSVYSKAIEIAQMEKNAAGENVLFSYQLRIWEEGKGNIPVADVFARKREGLLIPIHMNIYSTRYTPIGPFGERYVGSAFTEEGAWRKARQIAGDLRRDLLE